MHTLPGSPSRAIPESRLETNQLLAGLQDDDRRFFAEYAELREVKAGTVVIKQGEAGSEFFIVETGKFTFSVGGSADAPLAAESFGELALLFNAPRSATITATTDARLWVLDRSTFRIGVRNASRAKREETVRSLQKVKLLESLEQPQLEHLADVVKPVAFAAGSEVFRKGARGDVFYLIVSGELEMRDINGVTGVITKGGGDYFGEMALLTGEPRSATVVAKSDAKCLALSKYEFDSTVGPLKDLVKIAEHHKMLMGIEMLKNLDSVERMNAVRRFKMEVFKKGKVIIKEGDPGDRFFVISSGTVRCQHRVLQGARKVEWGGGAEL